MSDFRQLAQDIGSAPLGDLIAAIGRGVAEAQAALDAGSLEQTLALYDQDDELQLTLRELGYQPTFYTIPETEGELKLSLTVAGRRGGGAPVPTQPRSTSPLSILGSRLPLALGPRIYAAPVDGHYQNTYSYSSQVSATVKFKVVAVPPPSEAQSARVAPDLVGQTVEAARTLANSFDLEVDTAGDPAADAVVAGQSPAPGSLMTEGGTIAVTF